MAGTKTVVAITSFVCEIDGIQRFVHPGEVFGANDPVVKKHRELFEDPPPRTSGTTERR